MPETCSRCAYLTRTSLEQRFLLCRFWASNSIRLKGLRDAFGSDYIVGHCHMQPEAIACPMFVASELTENKTLANALHLNELMEVGA